MTYRDMMGEAGKRLEAAGIPEASWEAKALLLGVLGWELKDYATAMWDQVSESDQAVFMAALEKRENRIPLQQILGYAWFMGDKYYVNQDTLIPRDDSEVLVQAAIQCVKERKQSVKEQNYSDNALCTSFHQQSGAPWSGDVKGRQEQILSGGAKSIRVLDMCTGSGCLLIALALNWQDGDNMASCEETCRLEGLGVDIAAGAVEAAAKNAYDLKAGNLTFIQSDLFSKVTGTYDIIISNPPYIPTKDIESLDLEVRDHEPMIALDGGEDGLDFYKRIVQEAPHYLNKGGSLLFEIGYDEGHAVQKLMMDGGFSNVKIVRDLAGLDRVVQGVYTCLNN